MLGSWRWNVSFGVFGLMLTGIISLARNPWSVTLLRSVYAFIAFFIIAYIVRAVLAYILKPPALIGEQQHNEGKGGQLDLLTPDEGDDLNEILKSQLKDNSAPLPEMTADNAFQPLKPTRLVSAKNNEPEELAKAIRHLTGE